jgi:FSR family fosmidomycin resistance protein-like MFS transporter
VSTLAPPLAAQATPSVRARLSSICLSHAAVDFFSAIIIPLLSVLESRVHMSPAQGAMLIGAGSVSSGLIQPIVAWLSDRFDTRTVGTAGIALAAVAIGLLGHAHSFHQLLLIQVVGAAGIGAFHPVGAAAMGQLAAARRSIGVAVFFAAGMLGGIAGSLFAPAFARRFGLEPMVWTIPPALVVAALLAWAIHTIPHRGHDAHERHRSLSPLERRQAWLATGLLFTGNALRYTANVALNLLVIRWSELMALRDAGAPQLTPALRSAAASHNGPLQAAMQVGMGLGGLALGYAVPVRHEKATLIAVPVLGSLAILAMPHSAGAGAFALAGAAGFGYFGVMPITVAMSQRLLPHRTSLASSLMMGGAWAIAALGPVVAQRVYAAAGLNAAFVFAAALLFVAGLVSLPIPGSVIGRTAHH